MRRLLLSLAIVAAWVVAAEAQPVGGTYIFNPTVPSGVSTTLAAGYVKSSGTTLSSQAVPIPVPDGGIGVATLAANGVLYGNGASAVLATAPGAANTLLTSVGGVPTFRGAVGASIWRSTNQSVASGGSARITFDTAAWDTNSFWSAGSPDRLTVPFTGVYLIIGMSEFAASGLGTYRGQNLELIGAGNPNIGEQDWPPDATFGPPMTCERIIRLNANDQIALRVYQNSGGALNILTFGTQFMPLLTIVYLWA